MDEVGGLNKKRFRLWRINGENGKMNCANCAIAVDKTLDGFPASAMPYSPFKVKNKTVYLNRPNPSNVLELEFGSVFVKNISIAQIKKLLKPNQRGIVFGYNKGAQIGHFFNAINQKGTVKFLDGQSGKSAILKYDFYEFLPTNFKP